jgi:hypothetical protein
VSDSLHFLVKAGLLTRDIKGNYHQTNRSLSTGRLNVVAVAVHSLLRQMGEFALDALGKLPISERHFSGITMGVTAETMRRLWKKSRCAARESFRLLPTSSNRIGFAGLISSFSR